MRRVHVVISGRVQGVFFRAMLRDEADSRGVAGWVRNTDDGRVEAEVQGPPDAVAQVLAFCEEGPPQAEVTGVDVTEREPDDSLEEFRVV